MLDIKNKKDCVGCGLCVNICPKKCISLEIDSEGFAYPKIDKTKCINCGLCEKKCPKLQELKTLNRDKKPKVLAAWNSNENIRLDSTSGGAFSAIATKIIEENGYICGAVYKDNNQVEHIVTNDIKDLDKIRSSKYLQSDFSKVFKSIKEKLKNNKVLVCGTPCQIASLYLYLGHDDDNLLTCDFICRGVNSPKVFKMYINYLEEKYRSKVKSIKFKDKTYGWHNFSTKITFENNKSYIASRYYDSYMIGYLEHNAFMRECCYDCSFKSLPRKSDFTLADFWGIENIDKNLDNDHGTSMILVNSNKAEQFLKKINKTLIYQEVISDQVFAENICMTKSVERTKERDMVMKNLDKFSYKELSNRYFKEPPLLKRGYRSFRVLLSKIKRKVIKK